MAEFMRVRKTKVYKLQRSHKYVHEYKRLFRFQEHHVKWIAENLIDDSAETRGGALPTKVRLEAFPRYVADPGFQIGVGEDMGIDQSSACRSIHYVIEKLVQIAGNWIKFP